MGTTADKLNRLKETKALLKQRLTDKGIDISGENSFYRLADRVGEITGGTPKIRFCMQKYSHIEYLAVDGTQIDTYFPGDDYANLEQYLEEEVGNFVEIEIVAGKPCIIDMRSGNQIELSLTSVGRFGKAAPPGEIDSYAFTMPNNDVLFIEER